MDFEYRYTDEQEQFRQEVRAWLEENIPEEMKLPVDPVDITEKQYWWWREKQKELGAKGWLYPTYPIEYGGGGLTAEHETIIIEEFQRTNVPRAGSPVVLPSLLVWATEEQKQKFLVPLLKAQKMAWQKLTEPHSGADLASYESTAVRDGDDWILNGSSAFPGGHENDPSWYFGPMLTDPDAPRHRNLGFFMIPYPSPGLSITSLNLVHGNEAFNGEYLLFMNNVRVPGDHLIGGDHQGWQVTNTGLEMEHGGRGRAFPTDEVSDNLVTWMREKREKGESLGGDPVIQQVTMDAYIEAHIEGLFAKHTYWMYMNRMEIAWEGACSALFNRQYGLRNVWRVRDVMGMYSLLGTHEPRAPHGGAQEVYQRRAFVRQHGAGSLNIAKVVLARRIGISRTRERPAPTPSTSTSYAA